MIWCDLDNTLIWTWDPLITSPLLSIAFGLPMETKPPRGKGRRRLRQITVPEFGAGYASCRRSARRFLGELRRLDKVRLLTSALRTYAVAMNETFRFGFEPHEIITREDLHSGITADVDPRAVLIDNESWSGFDQRHEMRRRQKLRYLGVTAHRVVEVTYFCGDTGDRFETDWSSYIARVRMLLEKGRP